VVVQTLAASSTNAGAAGPAGAAESRTATNVIITGK
jgi:hypothetical protein